VDALVLPGAPHDLNQALNAQDKFTAVNDWIAATLGSWRFAARRIRAGVVGEPGLLALEDPAGAEFAEATAALLQ
jgi:hypothetical protein